MTLIQNPHLELYIAKPWLTHPTSKGTPQVPIIVGKGRCRWMLELPKLCTAVSMSGQQIKIILKKID